MGNGTLDAKGPNRPTNLRDSQWQLKNPDSNLDDLAHIYMGYQDPCLMKQWDDFSKESWKAFKGSIRLCLLTLNTTYNISTETTVVRSHTDLQWNALLEPRQPVLSPNSPPVRDKGNWTTHLPESSENFTIDFATAEIIAGQLATSFNMSASFFPGGDNYLDGSMFASSLIGEIIGPDPLKCPNSTENGFKGFENRMHNIAVSMTNT